MDCGYTSVSIDLDDLTTIVVIVVTRGGRAQSGGLIVLGVASRCKGCRARQWEVTNVVADAVSARVARVEWL